MPTWQISSPAPAECDNVMAPPPAQQNVKPFAPQPSTPTVKHVPVPLQPIRALKVHVLTVANCLIFPENVQPEIKPENHWPCRPR